MNDHTRARRRTIQRSVLAAVVCASLALIPAACGPFGKHSSAEGHNQKKGKTQASALTVVRESYQTTTSQAKTARVVLSLASWAPNTTAGGTTSGERSALTMDFGLLSSGVVDFANDRSAANMRFSNIPQFGTIEVRSVGSTVYEKFPPKVRSHIPSHGKPWLKIDQDKLYKKRYGVSLSQMQSGVPDESANQLDYLKGVGGPVEKVGQQKVRGVPTTHYRATVDLKKAAAEQGRQIKQAYGKLEKQMGTSKVPTEVWIDRKGRIRRLKMTFPAPEMPASQGGSTSAGAHRTGWMVITEDLYDFGLPVHVQKPPAGQTADFTQVVSKMSTSQGNTHP